MLAWVQQVYDKRYNRDTGVFSYFNRQTGETSRRKPVQLGSANLVCKAEEAAAKRIQSWALGLGECGTRVSPSLSARGVSVCSHPPPVVPVLETPEPPRSLPAINMPAAGLNLSAAFQFQRRENWQALQAVLLSPRQKQAAQTGFFEGTGKENNAPIADQNTPNAGENDKKQGSLYEKVDHERQHNQPKKAKRFGSLFGWRKQKQKQKQQALARGAPNCQQNQQPSQQ
jgi:hypothetical protein